MTADATPPSPAREAVDRTTLDSHLRGLLACDRFKDYGPNGLQVEGRREIRRIVSGVTASLALIDAAIEAGADAILVHHGLFWRGQDGRLTGWLKARVARLMRHDINLFAYHLPLDAHAELGNNAQLARVLGLRSEGRFGEQDLGFWGSDAEAAEAAGGAQADAPLTVESLVARAGTRLGRPPVLLPGDGRPLRRVAWCTGGAQGYFEGAIAAGADAFITGEISEPQAHLSRETGVAFLACGHHATERYGAPALGEHLATQFGLEHRFIEIDNPA